MRKRLQVLICATAILPCFGQLNAPTEPKPPTSIDARIVSMPPKDWYDKLAIWSTVGLVIVGAGGTIAALLSLRGIRAQVEQMKAQVSIMEAQSAVLTESVAVATRSAQAAEATVATMKRSERSWLVEKLNFGNKLPRESETRGKVIYAILKIKNIGDRPALIRIAQTRFHATKQLPDTPQYPPGAIIPDGQILAPGDEAHLRCLLEEGSLDDDQIAAIERTITAGLKLYLYGRFIYESVGVVGTNQFCYRWDNQMGFSLEGDKPGFVKDGPAAYNSHT